MNWEEWLQEHGVNIFVGFLGLAGAIFVFFLNQQVSAYENTIFQNEKNIKNHIDEIESINKKLKDLTKDKSCDCAAYNIILKNHEDKIGSLTKALKQKISEQSAEEN